MKKPLILFLILLLVNAPAFTQSGSICSTALSLDPVLRTDGQITLGTEIWYKVIASSPSLNIEINSKDAGVTGKLDRAIFYSGTCVSLTEIDRDTAISGSDTLLNIEANSLTSGNTYYLKLSFNILTCPLCTPKYHIYLMPFTPPCLASNGCYDPQTCALVCNGSFETYFACPTAFSNMTQCCNWHVPTLAFSDYFNSCTSVSNPANNPDVPVNTIGYQNTYHGHGYGGFYLYADAGNINISNAREYMYQELRRPLDTAVTYKVRFYVSLANKSKYAVSSIGALFLTTLSNQGGGGVWNNGNSTPQILNTAYIMDTMNWVRIEGTYKPTQVGQKYMILGNFKNDGPTAPIVVNNTTHYVEPSNGCAFAYYYVDSVSVTPLPPSIKNSPLTVCMTRPDTLKPVAVPNDPSATYSWDFGDGDVISGLGTANIPANTNGGRTTGTYKNPIHRWALPGNFVVTMIVVSPTGCSLSAKHIVTVIPSTANYNTNCCSNGVTYDLDANLNGPIPKITAPLSNPQVWSTNKKIRGTLIVGANSALTIQNATIQFDPASKIIVEPGGVLTLDNAILTGLTTCVTMWIGVEVWGNKFFSQTAIDPNTNGLYQGKIIMKNASAIQHAHFGITLGKPNVTAAGFDIRFSGGILDASQVTSSIVNFFNCAIGVRIAKYTFTNVSKIQNSQYNGSSLRDPGYKIGNSYYTYPINANNLFYANANFLQRASIHLYMWDVKVAPSVQDNQFLNAETGILSYDTRYTVRSIGIGPTSSYSSGFGDLTNGVRSYTTYSSFVNTLSLLHNSFDRKITQSCVYIDAGLYSTIKNTNSFNKGIFPQANFGNGVYLRNAWGFNISDNIFNPINIGILCFNSTNGGFIGYEQSGNTFLRSRRSVLTTGNNSNLMIRCNATDNTVGTEYYRNWENTNTSPLANQGAYSTTDETKPAGNQFNVSNPSINKEIISSTGYFYFAHSSPSKFVPNDPNNIITIDANSIASSSVQNSCTQPPGSPSQKVTQMDSISDYIDSLETRYQYVEGILDNGNTSQLITEINSNTPPADLQSDLLSNSPLSDAVLIAFITRTYSTPDTVFYNVMLPNLPVSDAVLPYLKTKLTSFPVNLAKAIMLKHVTNPSPIGTLAGLSRKMIDLGVARNQILSSLISYCVERDSIAAVVGLLENEGTVEAKMQLAVHYYSTGDYSSAQDKLADLPTGIVSTDAFIDLMSIMIDLASQDKTVFDMSSSQETIIRDIAAYTPASLATSNAQAILKLVFGEEPNTASDTTSFGLRVMGNNSITLSKEQGKQYISQSAPNPAGDLTTINYYVPDESKRAEMNIYDATGRIIKTYKLEAGNNTLEVNTSDLTNGVYMYGLLIDGAVIQSKKFVVGKQ